MIFRGDQIYSVDPATRFGAFKRALEVAELRDLDRALMLKLGLFQAGRTPGRITTRPGCHTPSGMREDGGKRTKGNPR